MGCLPFFLDSEFLLTLGFLEGQFTFLLFSDPLFLPLLEDRFELIHCAAVLLSELEQLASMLLLLPLLLSPLFLVLFRHKLVHQLVSPLG